MPSRKSLIYQRFVSIQVSSCCICRDLPVSITIALRFVSILFLIDSFSPDINVKQVLRGFLKFNNFGQWPQDRLDTHWHKNVLTNSSVPGLCTNITVTEWTHLFFKTVRATGFAVQWRALGCIACHVTWLRLTGVLSVPRYLTSVQCMARTTSTALLVLWWKK